MDITVLFLRILLTLDQTPKGGPKTLIFGENLENRADLLRILPNIMDISEIAITEYYGILWSVITSPPAGRGGQV